MVSLESEAMIVIYIFLLSFGLTIDLGLLIMPIWLIREIKSDKTNRYGFIDLVIVAILLLGFVYTTTLLIMFLNTLWLK